MRIPLYRLDYAPKPTGIGLVETPRARGRDGPLVRKTVMRAFGTVSSTSPEMLRKLGKKGVAGVDPGTGIVPANLPAGRNLA